jgi:signal transduction histidine kinase
MPDLAGLLKRLLTSWRGDVLLAAVLAAWAIGYLGQAAARGNPQWTALLFVLPFAATVAIRRRWPVAATAVACAVLLAAEPLGVAAALNGALGTPLLIVPFLLGYTLGTESSVAAGLAGTVLLAASLQIAGGGFSVVAEMIIFGPWLAGRVVLSRRRLADQLQARNDDLRAEQAAFAEESVRYERARIARDLHDVVAHCLSVMVVQASAGQRMTDSGEVAEALESVAAAAAQARTEIGRLVELLAGEMPSATSARLPMVAELVHRASATGLAVNCCFMGACDQLGPTASEAAYRVVQEALTNALKHAPGAPVDITVRGNDAGVTVDIVNAAALESPASLARSGGGYGLAGMRERVQACGGCLTSGPTATGGWQVSAALPAHGRAGGVPAFPLSCPCRVLGGPVYPGRMCLGRAPREEGPCPEIRRTA